MHNGNWPDHKRMPMYKFSLAPYYTGNSVIFMPPFLFIRFSAVFNANDLVVPTLSLSLSLSLWHFSFSTFIYVFTVLHDL